jgi:MFS family permease
MTLKERFPAFTGRNYRLFWTAQFISLTGVWMQSVAQGWLIYKLSMSPAALAAAAIALSAPVFVFSVFGGLAADFVDRKKLLVSTQIAASVPALILYYITATDKASVEWIIALAAMTGVVNAFEYPARHAMTAEIVTRDKLTSAVTLQAVAFNATRMIGSSAAGFIIVVSSPAICFLINFVSYLTGALLYSMIEQEAASTGRDSVKNTRSIADGIKFILKRRDITGVLIIVAAVSLFGIPFIPMLPLFAEGVLHSGADGLGMLSGITGAGSMIAAITVACMPEISHKGRNMVFSAFFFAFSLFLFARSTNLYFSMAALAAAGWGIVCILALANCFIQHKCPSHMRGRVMAAFSFALVGLAPVGHAVMGYSAGKLGVADAVSMSSLICILIVIAGGVNLIKNPA